ncbi:PTS lactose/cellobiose transporter subunit IIA [uncultured Megasphaera sp.]|uniref:PTS lactose/cellobiose transporter subunit IIA n=1 Tax=uncultured Megasphaera sp. TaxID=165188 RepID=UPI0025F3E9A1|nr:PTS lactose/cellobiose transporter subunit IIA [uncultured Megasphaera sp.]
MTKENMAKIEEIAFEIISTAGDGRIKVKLALKEARRGNFGDAKDLLKEADQFILKAHEIQTNELLGRQARGEFSEPYSPIIAHAQDYIMTTMDFKEVAEEIVNLYAKILAI